MIRAKTENIRVPVAVHGSKTSVLKLPNNNNNNKTQSKHAKTSSVAPRYECY